MSDRQESFHGYAVPEVTDQQFSAVVSKYNDGDGCPVPSSVCRGIGCAACLFDNIYPKKGIASKRYVFRAYAETEKGYVLVGDKLVKKQEEQPKQANDMPALQPGMLVRTGDDSWVLMITSDFGYELLYGPAVTLHQIRQVDQDCIDMVLVDNQKVGRTGLIRVTDINNIALTGELGLRLTKIWERKKPVKLTVAQVSEKLGYPVEIVEE